MKNDYSALFKNASTYAIKNSIDNIKHISQVQSDLAASLRDHQQKRAESYKIIDSVQSRMLNTKQ